MMITVEQGERYRSGDDKAEEQLREWHLEQEWEATPNTPWQIRQDGRQIEVTSSRSKDNIDKNRSEICVTSIEFVALEFNSYATGFR